MTTIEKVLSYTTPRNVRLLLLAYVVMFLAAIALFATHSTVLFSGLMALSIMMWFPITRDLVPVCWSVVVKGRWPDGVNIKTPL